jgi:hypothetical protein
MASTAGRNIIFASSVSVYPPYIEIEELKQARRRLSVMSDNKLVEGLGDVNLNDKEETEVMVERSR